MWEEECLPAKIHIDLNNKGIKVINEHSHDNTLTNISVKRIISNANELALTQWKVLLFCTKEP